VLKVSEVYEKQIKVTNERPDGSEYVNFTKVYDTRACLINPSYIVSVHPHEFTASSDDKKMEGRFPEGEKFSMFVLDGNSFRNSEMFVVGSFDKFCRLLQENKT
jgi:hypothetical protein|tara:strand:+ start:26 stop:337 length:312 start_codon:yes stop_codon:yes gene_type:complete